MRGPEKGHIHLQFKDSTVFRWSQWISPNYFNKFPLPCQNKKALTFVSAFLFWRRERDSNPRTGFNRYTISNRAPSTNSAISASIFTCAASATLAIITGFDKMSSTFLIPPVIFSPGDLSVNSVEDYSLGPASTRALPASLAVYLVKFLMKRAARS